MCRTTISTSRAALIHYLYQNNGLTKNVVFVVFEKLSSTKCQIYKSCEKKIWYYGTEMIKLTPKC